MYHSTLTASLKQQTARNLELACLKMLVRIILIVHNIYLLFLYLFSNVKVLADNFPNLSVTLCSHVLRSVSDQMEWAYMQTDWTPSGLRILRAEFQLQTK